MQLHAILFQNDGWHVAQCVELDLASQGNDEEQALLNLKEALTLHFQKPSHTELGAFAESIEEAQKLLGSTVLHEIEQT